MKCKGKSHDQRYPYPSHPCNNNVWKDGYCKIHHPEEKRKRQKIRDDKKEKLWEDRQKRRPAIQQKLQSFREQLENLGPDDYLKNMGIAIKLFDETFKTKK